MMMGFFSERGIEIAVAAAAVTLVAIIGGLMTEVGAWYEGLRFPSLRPPNWLFGPAWTVIFILIAAAGVIGWESAGSGNERFRLIVLFALNGVLNVLWSPLFFKLRRPDWALYEVPFLWLSVLAPIILLAPINTTASLLLVPYLIWVSFTSVLNLSLWKLNQ